MACGRVTLASLGASLGLRSKEDARQKDCPLRAVPSDIPQPVETCDLPAPQDRPEPEATRRGEQAGGEEREACTGRGERRRAGCSGSRPVEEAR